MKVYLAIIPEEGHLDKDHEIRIAIDKHIDKTGCRYCVSFMRWHLDPKFARFAKKPKMCSCPVAIAITKAFLSKQKKSHKLRIAI